MKQLPLKNFDALFLSSHNNILYLTNYAGFSPTERETFVLITKKNNYLFTDARYTEQVKSQIKDFTVLQRSHATPLNTLLQTIVNKEKLEIIGYEADDLTVAEYTHLKKVLPKMKSVDLKNLRSIKTPEEIQKIRTACQLGDKAFVEITKH